VPLLDLLFPQRCAGCQRYGADWCEQCASSVEALEPASLSGIPLLAGGRFAGPLQRAIHRYKYGGRQQLARDLSGSLLQAVRRAEIQLSALTFVPLHAERLRQRGFNQAERIAVQLGKQLGLPVVDGLTRVRATPAQVGLSQAARRLNLVDAFLWSGPGRPPAALGLVDDVCTTGATLEAAVDAIRLAGGSPAALLVVARAQTLPAALVTSQEQSGCS
jgi:ComF family protein